MAELTETPPLRHRSRSVLGRAWAAVVDFLSWWSAGLLGAVPRSLRHALYARRSRLVLDLCASPPLWAHEVGPWAQPQIRVSAPFMRSPEGADAQEPLAAQLAEAELLTMRVPPAWVLTKILSLPAAAADHLQEVLAFEIPRQMAFQPDDTYLHTRVLALDDPESRLRVEVTLIPRKLIDPLLSDLPTPNARHVLLRPAMQDGSAWKIAIKLQRPRLIRRHPTLDTSLRIMPIVWLCLLWAAPAVVAQRQIEAHRAEIAALTPQVAAISQARAAAERAVARADAIMTQRQRAPDPALLLAKLAAAFEGQAHVRQIDVSAQTLIVRGTTREPGKIAGRVDAAAEFDSVTFQSTAQPIGYDERGFDLQARIVTP